ncbi:MAG: PilZ domain-containing protein [Phycisphaerae bacterium]|nr:PilZ domain-containing protein [Phycisphaerae bacterium]
MSRLPTHQTERREFSRATVEVPVTAVRRNRPVEDRRHVISLHVLNVSRGGLGAMATDPLETKEPVVVFFPPMGPRKGRDTRGQVVRCEERGDRYAVGIAFDEPWPTREAPAEQGVN